MYSRNLHDETSNKVADLEHELTCYKSALTHFHEKTTQYKIIDDKIKKLKTTLILLGATVDD